MITYLQGDATQPVGHDNAIIAHVCNDRGGWGRGFVLALSNRWCQPEDAYRRWHRGELSEIVPFELGKTLFVFCGVTRPLWVANMIAQVGYGRDNKRLHRSDEIDSTIPLRYDALRMCLLDVADHARTNNASVHMPRIGCGLAGGRWEIVEQIIIETFMNTPVYVYDL